MIALRVGALVGCLFMLFACNNGPTAPTPLPPSPPATVQPPPTSVLPPVSGNARAYVFNAPVSYQVRGYTMMSRYVLRSGGTFSLQYASLGIEYVGTFTEDNGIVSFRFAADGRWDAIGTVSGDSLEVRYNVVMEHSDFENAVYRRSQ
jgi:hypothetical protein